MRIKFFKDHTVKNQAAAHYKAGQIVEMNQASAMHFINRNLAVEVKDEPKAQVESRATPAPTEKAVKGRDKPSRTI